MLRDRLKLKFRAKQILRHFVNTLIKISGLNATALQRVEGSQFCSIVCLRFNRLRNHPPKQNLKSHRMSTAMMSYEELTITSINTIFKGYVMIVIITVKCNVKFVEKEAIFL